MSGFTKVVERIIESYIEDPELIDSLSLIRGAMESIWTNDARIVQDHTDHGKDHCERVAGYAEKLLQVNPNMKFSEQEIYLLVAGIYLHDIGMQCDVVKYPEVRKRAEDFGATFKVEFTAETANSYPPEQQNEIREYHHLLSAAWIDYIYEGKDPVLFSAFERIPDDLIEDLMDICRFHSKLPINDCPAFFLHDPNNRKKMTAALLRFADELDISRKRADLKTVQIHHFKPENSVYWWLHYYTKVSFIGANKIRVTVRMHPKDFNLYGSFVRENYIKKFKTKNQTILEVLAEYDIFIIIDKESDVKSDKHVKEFPSEITSILDKQMQKENLKGEHLIRMLQSESCFNKTIENTQKIDNEILNIENEEFKLKILELLKEKLNLTKGNGFTVNIDIENFNVFVGANYNNYYNLENLSDDKQIKNIKYLNQERRDATNQDILNSNISLTVLDSHEKLKQFINKTLANDFDNEKLEGEYLAQLEQIKDHLKNKNPTEALHSVKLLENRIWATSSSKVKYNLLKLKASANLDLYKYKEAGKLFLEACQYNPEDEKAILNSSFGYLLLGEKSKSRELALKVLERNPVNAQAYSILIQTGSDEDMETIPQYMKENQDVAYALGSYFYKKGNLDEAKKWLEISLENETENILEIRTLLASVLVDSVLSDPKAIPGFQLNSLHRVKIEKAIDLYTYAWKSILDKNLQLLHVDWIINRAIAKRLLGEIESAETDINYAYELDSSNPKALHFKALVEFENGEFDKVVSSFKSKLSTDFEVGGLILYLEALKKLEKADDAIIELNEFLKQNPKFEEREHLEQFLIYTYLDLCKYNEARDLAELRLKQDSESVTNIVNLANVMRTIGEIESSISLLKKAKDQLSNSSKFTDLKMIANELLRAKLFEDAYEVYRLFVDSTQITELTHKMIDACYRSGNIGRALEICKSLRRKFGPIVHITQIEIEIYHEINDLEKERNILTEYLRHFPDDYGMKLNLALLNRRCKHYDKVDEFLRIPFDTSWLPVEGCICLAFLFNERGCFQKSVEILYELRRNNFNNEKAHSSYIKLISFNEAEENQNWIRPTEVGIDSAIVIEDSHGKKQNYIIEGRRDADLQKGELKPDSGLAVRLLGKREGDKVVFETPVSEEVFEIKELKSKYIYAFQESVNIFNRLFPDSKELFQISISEKGKDDISSEGLEKIKEMARLNFEQNEKMKLMYIKEKRPVGNVSNLFRKNIFDLWLYFTKDSNLGIYCSTGYTEIKEALDYFKKDLRLVVDPLSILTIVTLDIGDIIKNYFGKLRVSQSTIDLFQELLIEKNSTNSKEHSIFGYLDGNFFIQEVDVESKQNITGKLNSVLEWIQINCEVLPCNRALSIKREKRTELDKAIGSAFTDTILIACEEGNNLYSEEKIIRDIAIQEFNITGIWTQALLVYLLDDGFVEKHQYNQKTIQLINLNYHHTSINPEILLDAAKQAKWKFTSPFIKVLKILEGKNCNEDSALNLTINFIFLILREQIPIDDFYALFIHTLNMVVKGRWAPLIINKLKVMVIYRFDLFSFEDRMEILELIEIWQMIYYNTFSTNHNE